MAPGGRLDSPKIDVFNPRRLSDRQVEAIATGREPLLAEILKHIEQAARGGPIQHLGLIAPRGYGKSFLLRQLRLRVERLAAQGLPVAFAHLPEELPNVVSIAGLIGEIGRFVAGDLSGGIGALRDEAPEALDQALAGLDATLDGRFGPGRGVVVAAIENFDALLDKLVRKAARAQRRRGGAPGPVRSKGGRAGPSPSELAVELALRGVLERRGNRLLLVVSATRDIRNASPGHPLFQWLIEHTLDPWTTRDVLDYAQRRRRLAGGPATRLTPPEQTQLRALADFTNGAPRMIAVLVDHLLARNLDQATLNLAALIDELTPYFKHRLEDLSDECQQVFDALLRGGEPVSQQDLARRFAEPDLAQNDIAEAFRRLQEERLVIGTRASRGQARLYRAADRVMAYWYKQRQIIGHDPARSGISHFEEAVELLVTWYTRDDLRLEAERSAERAAAAGDPGPASRALVQRSWTLRALARPDEALAAAREAVTLARDACADQDEIRAARVLFETLYRLRRADEMLAEAQAARERWTRLGRLDGQVESMVHEAGALLLLDRRDQADALADQAIALGAGDDRLRQWALERWAWFLGESGRHEESITRCAQAADLAARLGDTLGRTESLRNLLIYARRLPRSADLAGQGQRVLDAFAQLAGLDPAGALTWAHDALRAAAALGRYQTFETGLRRAAGAGDQGTGGLWMLAAELARIGRTDGRAPAYAALVSVLAALTPETGTVPPGPDPRVALVRALTLGIEDPGLLRDLAELLSELAEQAGQEETGQEARTDASRGRDARATGGAVSAQIDALRARALDLESGGRPAALERVDPDLARMLSALRAPDPLPTGLPQADDPAVNLSPCVVAPPGAERFAGLPLGPADPETRARFERLAPALGLPNLAGFDSTGLRTAGLPFLPGALLLLLPHRSGAVAVPFVIAGERLLLAARQIGWVYPLIEGHPLDLGTGETVTEALGAYLRLFLAVIRTADGQAFRLIEHPDRIPWLPEAPATERVRVGSLIAPLKRLRQDGEAAVLECSVIHAKALRRATLKVSPDGRIDMTGDEALAEDLPVAAGAAVEMVVTE